MYVKATTNDNRVVLWERHVKHPDGECFIVANGKVNQVGDTPMVREYIRTGKIDEVPAPAEPVAPVPEAVDASSDELSSDQPPAVTEPASDDAPASTEGAGEGDGEGTEPSSGKPKPAKK